MVVTASGLGWVTTVRVLAALQGAVRRIDMNGPSAFLTSGAGLSLAMAFHELGTNAFKYGSLSVRDARASLAWAFDPADPQQIEIRWVEIGGPDVVAPTRRGFGSRLASEISGRVVIDYDPTGVRCIIIGRMVEAVPSLNMSLA